MEALLTAVTLTALFGVVVFLVFAALDRAVVGRWYGSPVGARFDSGLVNPDGSPRPAFAIFKTYAKARQK